MRFAAITESTVGVLAPKSWRVCICAVLGVPPECTDDSAAIVGMALEKHKLSRQAGGLKVACSSYSMTSSSIMSHNVV
jgi:hypothetical protein